MHTNAADPEHERFTRAHDAPAPIFGNDFLDDVSLAEELGSQPIRKLMPIAKRIGLFILTWFKQAVTRMDGAPSGEFSAGLGLATVDRIARMHEAQFDLLPRVGGGTEARRTCPA